MTSFRLNILVKGGFFMKEFLINFITRNKVWLIIVGSMLVVIIASSVTFVYVYQNKEDDCTTTELLSVSTSTLDSAIEEDETEEDDSSSGDYVYIDIKGAVENPGVYKVDSNAIINDAITLAGGFSSDAVTTNINLSKKVSDEMVIYVYKTSDYENVDVCIVESLTEEAETSSSIKTDDIYIDDYTSNYESVIESEYSECVESCIESSSSSSTSETSGLININTASLSELMTLSGIGESKAEAIISYREQYGGFSSTDELTNVSGIGDSTYDAIKDLITV